MDDINYIYMTAALMGLTLLSQVFRRRFDPFAPVWLFFVGYGQVYVIQALSYREYALRVRGPEVTALASQRALWALVLFLAVYFLAPSGWLARRLPSPPRAWSPGLVLILTPLLVVWGLFCAVQVIRGGSDGPVSEGAALLGAFPMVMLVGGVLMLVTGRNQDHPRFGFTAAGLAIVVAYVLIWMFNGKRSHSLIGVLVGLCAFYVPRMKRPSKPVLVVTAILGSMTVAIALGWRNNPNYTRDAAGFIDFIGDFDPSTVLVSLNLKDKHEDGPTSKPKSYETEEYGGYLLMLATVPEKAEYDYGEVYLRLYSTFIPRKFLWPDKPYYGRDKWVAAWVAGSEFPRKDDFTGPAISVLGAGQLNGGAVGTAILMTVLAVMMRTAYLYFRTYPDRTWTQAWWAVTYFNAWMLVVNDDPFIWFYYNYGFTTFIPILGLWAYFKIAGAGRDQEGLPSASAWAAA
jgi:hypothetical protein